VCFLPPDFGLFPPAEEQEREGSVQDDADHSGGERTILLQTDLSPCFSMLPHHQHQVPARGTRLPTRGQQEEGDVRFTLTSHNNLTERERASKKQLPSL
jgi:hypothetical protein